MEQNTLYCGATIDYSYGVKCTTKDCSLLLIITAPSWKPIFLSLLVHQDSYRRVVQMTWGGAICSFAGFSSSFEGGLETHGHLKLEARWRERHYSGCISIAYVTVSLMLFHYHCLYLYYSICVACNHKHHALHIFWIFVTSCVSAVLVWFSLFFCNVCWNDRALSTGVWLSPCNIYSRDQIMQEKVTSWQGFVFPYFHFNEGICPRLGWVSHATQ